MPPNQRSARLLFMPRPFAQKFTGVCAAIGLLAGTASADSGFDFNSGIAFDSNVSNGQYSGDVKSDTALNIAATASNAWSVGKNARFSADGKLAAQAFDHYHALNNIAPEIAAAFKVKSDLGAQAPWLNVAAAASQLYANSKVRRGAQYRASVAIGKQIDPRWSARGEYRFDKRVAEHGDSEVANLATDVFSQIGHTAAANISYLFNSAAVLQFGYARREGDVTATTLPYYAVYRISSAIAEDDAFGDERYAYRLHAVTHSITGTFSLELDRHSALNFSLRRNITHGAGNFNYYNSGFAIDYSYRY